MSDDSSDYRSPTNWRKRFRDRTRSGLKVISVYEYAGESLAVILDPNDRLSAVKNGELLLRQPVKKSVTAWAQVVDGIIVETYVKYKPMVDNDTLIIELKGEYEGME